jgi:hypothetical protein
MANNEFINTNLINGENDPNNILDLFIKNIRNIPSLITAFKLLEINFISQENHYQVIHGVNLKFQDSAKRIINSIDVLMEGETKNLPNFDYEEIFKIRKTIDSFDSSDFELMKITKEKFDELIEFINFIEKNFSKTNLTIQQTQKIKNETEIVRYELSY